jgi:hypothetical protein
MWLQGIAEGKRSNSDGRRGCQLGQQEMAEDCLAEIPAGFQLFGAGMSKKGIEMTRRRSVGMGGGENRFWAVATPL